MDLRNQYGRLKINKLTFPKSTVPASIALTFPSKYIIADILAPEVPSYVERDYARSVLQPYELAVRSMGNSDYLYDLNQINNSGERLLTGLQQIADNTVPESDTCVLIVCYLEFND